MVGELMVFAATEAVVFLATALVFYGPKATHDDDEIARFETAGDAVEARGRTAPASQPSGV